MSQPNTFYFVGKDGQQYQTDAHGYVCNNQGRRIGDSSGNPISYTNFDQFPGNKVQTSIAVNENEIQKQTNAAKHKARARLALVILAAMFVLGGIACVTYFAVKTAKDAENKASTSAQTGGNSGVDNRPVTVNVMLGFDASGSPITHAASGSGGGGGSGGGSGGGGLRRRSIGALAHAVGRLGRGATSTWPDAVQAVRVRFAVWKPKAGSGETDTGTAAVEPEVPGKSMPSPKKDSGAGATGKSGASESVATGAMTIVEEQFETRVDAADLADHPISFTSSALAAVGEDGWYYTVDAVAIPRSMAVLPAFVDSITTMPIIILPRVPADNAQIVDTFRYDNSIFPEDTTQAQWSAMMTDTMYSGQTWTPWTVDDTAQQSPKFLTLLPIVVKVAVNTEDLVRTTQMLASPITQEMQKDANGVYTVAYTVRMGIQLPARELTGDVVAALNGYDFYIGCVRPTPAAVLDYECTSTVTRIETQASFLASRDSPTTPATLEDVNGGQFVVTATVTVQFDALKTLAEVYNIAVGGYSQKLPAGQPSAHRLANVASTVANSVDVTPAPRSRIVGAASVKSYIVWTTVYRMTSTTIQFARFPDVTVQSFVPLFMDATSDPTVVKATTSFKVNTFAAGTDAIDIRYLNGAQAFSLLKPGALGTQRRDVPPGSTQITTDIVDGGTNVQCQWTLSALAGDSTHYTDPTANVQRTIIEYQIVSSVAADRVQPVVCQLYIAIIDKSVPSASGNIEFPYATVILPIFLYNGPADMITTLPTIVMKGKTEIGISRSSAMPDMTFITRSQRGTEAWKLASENNSGYVRMYLTADASIKSIPKTCFGPGGFIDGSQRAECGGIARLSMTNIQVSMATPVLLSSPEDVWQATTTVSGVTFNAAGLFAGGADPVSAACNSGGRLNVLFSLGYANDALNANNLLFARDDNRAYEFVTVRCTSKF